MKQIKKMMALVLAMVMVLAMGTSVFAATGTASGQGGNATIKVTLPTGRTGDNDYKVYKVFDATNDGSSSAIAYKVMASKNGALPVITPAEENSFFVDDAGNVHYGKFTESASGTYMVGGKKGTITEASSLTEGAIKAIATYVDGDSPVATVTATKDDADFTVTGLQYGYYYITTTTGTAVTVDSTNPNAEVEDKNSVPTLDKKITGATGYVDDAGKKAIGQVGTDVKYSAEITVGKGAENYVLHDKMATGLSYNNDVKVFVGGEEIKGATYFNTTTAEGDTLTVNFVNTYIATLAEGTKITVTYSAKITNDALTYVPEKNTAVLDYGDENKPQSTPKSETETYSAKFTVTKTDDKNQALAGAGFIISRAAGSEVENPDYDATAAAAAEAAGEPYDVPATITTTTTEYYKITGTGSSAVVSWVTDIAQATELTTTKDEGGNVLVFKGLPTGTYTLIEKTVPAGYNKAADYEFTVAEDTYTQANLEQETTVINNSGQELPSTGGIGTTIFYVIGAILVLGAGILLVTRRRMNAN